tara:strand:+ start:569 stop:823 length:255 start_codon:yes stop_codon:yes gene_type:complete
MSKKSKLTKEQQRELDKHTQEIIEDAKKVISDYSENPSDISGSVIQVNENSPYLDEEFKGNSWKKVIRGGIQNALSHIKKNKKA